MYTQTKISSFKCEYCGKEFSISDYNNDINATKQATLLHQKECKNKFKICLGDVFLFNVDKDQNNKMCHCCLCCSNTPYSTFLTPPMKIIYVDISNPQKKILHVVLAKYNHILKVWEEDKDVMKWYKDNFGLKYFTMYESQINRQINLKDFKESFKIVEIFEDWIKENNPHNKKQCKFDLGYEFDKNNIIVTIKIPYKTKGRV